jgi:hypothetical protein
VEIHSSLYARGLETRSEGVVEIEPDRASKFNRTQQTSTDIHKVLYVEHLVPNRNLAPIEIYGIQRGTTALF